MHFYPDRESSENRKLAELPEFNLALADPFPQQYENYFNDHISVKNNLVYLKNLIKYSVFKETPLPYKVYLGSEGWFFFNNAMLPARRQASFFSNDQLNRIRKEIEFRNNYFAERNAIYFLAIVPAKASVYPEYTRGINQFHISDSSRTDQLLRLLQDSTDTHIIDLRQALLKIKNQHQVFFKTDHHWNYMGALAGSIMVLDSVRNYFPNIPKLSFSDFDTLEIKERTGDLLKLTGLTDLLSEEYPKYKPNKAWQKKLKKDKTRKYEKPEGFAYDWAYEIRRTTGDSSLPSVMIIRDSYGDYIRDFVSHGFNNTLLIWDKWKYKINEPIFNEEKPQVFITMITEAMLFKLLQQPDREEQAKK